MNDEQPSHHGMGSWTRKYFVHGIMLRLRGWMYMQRQLAVLS
jgi:hypothetical protein